MRDIRYGAVCKWSYASITRTASLFPTILLVIRLSCLWITVERLHVRPFLGFLLP